MADANLGSGYRAKCGVGKEGADAYGTLVAPTEIVPFVSLDTNQNIVKAESNVLIGEAWNEDNEDLIKKEVRGSLVCIADYEALDFLFALAFASTVTKTGASAPYSHEFILSTADIQRSVSLSIDKRIEDDYVEGVKIDELVFSSTPDNVGVTFGIVGEEITRGSTHQAALRALTFTLGKRLFHDQAVFRIADCADALAAGDAQDVSEFEMTLNNNLAVDHYTTTSGVKISEPYRNGKGTVMFRFVIPTYAANTFVAARDSETKLQADIIYTGATLGGGTYTLKFEFPTVKVTSAEYAISDAGLIQHVVECKCYNNNANTNMSAIDEPVELTIQNNRATEVWA